MGLSDFFNGKKYRLENEQLKSTLAENQKLMDELGYTEYAQVKSEIDKLTAEIDEN